VRVDFHGVTHTPDVFAGWAREVEEAGYDSMWMSETRHDPFIGLTAAALRTSASPSHRAGRWCSRVTR